MSPDASGFAPAVEEGPRKDANFLVAFDADSVTTGADEWDASGGS